MSTLPTLPVEINNTAKNTSSTSYLAVDGVPAHIKIGKITNNGLMTLIFSKAIYQLPDPSILLNYEYQSVES